ncbi:MAG: hypothetical protein JEY99_00450 [Spirochaetales bacterium]|nr:hypothetical protein [Spirochaetales bacterium]
MKNTIILLTALLIIFSFTACDDKEMGIFYSIEEERKVEDNKIENNASIGNMVLFGDNYYAAAGNLYTVNAASNYAYYTDSNSEGTWSIETGLPADKLCMSVGEVNNSLYGVFFDRTDVSSDPSDLNADLYVKGVDGWTEYVPSGTDIPADLKIEKLVALNDVGFVQAYTLDDSNTRNYAIYFFNGTNFSELPTSTVDLTSGVSSEFDVAMDGDSDGDFEYWITYGTSLFTLTSADPANATLILVEDTAIYSGTNATDDDSLMGIYHSDIFGALFLAKSDGTVYYRTDATVAEPSVIWTAVTDEVPTEPGDFIDFTFIGSDGTTIKEVLLVGSRNGYYEFEKVDGVSITETEFVLPEESAKQATYSTLDLRYAIVSSFFVHEISSGNKILFALTMKNGLWSNIEYDDEVYRIWNIE